MEYGLLRPLKRATALVHPSVYAPCGPQRGTTLVHPSVYAPCGPNGGTILVHARLPVSGVDEIQRRYFYFYFILFHLTYSRWTSSLPSCLWSLRIFPSLPGSRLTIFLSRCKFSTLTTRQPMVEFYLLTFRRFPLRKKEHKSYFGKNRTHDFRTSRCADYLPDDSGDALRTQINGIRPRAALKRDTALVYPTVYAPCGPKRGTTLVHARCPVSGVDDIQRRYWARK